MTDLVRPSGLIDFLVGLAIGFSWGFLFAYWVW
jgi:hypothetical protein